MKKLLFTASILGALAFAFVYAPNDADAQRYRRRRCARLANQVNSWSAVRNNHIRRWNRCKAVLGWSHPKCQRIRNTVAAWQQNVNVARSNYSQWGCRFAWDSWNDPWATPAPAPSYANQNCAKLGNRVARWRNIRTNYINSWNNCKANLGWGHPRCRRIRARVHAWNRNVNAARNNYRAWGCRFRWGQWNNPW
jgi:hypothetical protein